MKAIFVTIFVIILCLLFASCDVVRANKFEVTNETGYELQEFQVLFGDAVAKRQSLGDGETFAFRPSPGRDGGISISYKKNGKIVKHDLGYVAPPISMSCKFQVSDAAVLGGCQ